VAEIFRDGFNGTPGDDLNAYSPSWVRQPGTTTAMLIGPDGQSATATTSANTASYFRSDVTPPNADYSVSVDVTLLATLTNAAAVGLTIRASSAELTHYQFRFSASTFPPKGAWQLRRIVNNTATVLSSLAGTFDAGESHNLRMVTSGELVSAYLDNATSPILGPNSSTINDVGYGGLLATNAPSTRARYDNFVIDNGLAAGQPGNATVIGVAANPAAGIVLASGAGSATVTGVRANPVAGNVSASGAASAIVPGVAASPSAGIATASGASSAQITGVSAKPETGEVSASDSANAIIIGVAANPAAGLVSVGSGGAASVIGVVANPSAGELVASGSASAIIIGVYENPAAGIVIAEAETEQDEDIDALLVPLARTVRFEGSIRIVAFEGSKRMVRFEGGNRIVRFE
jgi:hypothetical protein